MPDPSFRPEWRRPGDVAVVQRREGVFLVPAESGRFHPSMWTPFPSKARADQALLGAIPQRLQLVDVADPEALARLANEMGFLTPIESASSSCPFEALERGPGTRAATTWCERVDTAQVAILEYRIGVELRVASRSRRSVPPACLRRSPLFEGQWELVLRLPDGIPPSVTLHPPMPRTFYEDAGKVISIDKLPAGTVQEAAKRWYAHLARARLPVWETRDEALRWTIGAPVGFAWYELHYGKRWPRHCKYCDRAFTVNERSRRGHGDYCSTLCRKRAAAGRRRDSAKGKCKARRAPKRKG